MMKNNLVLFAHRYDALGWRVKSTRTDTAGTRNTHYVRDASGNVLGIYENESPKEAHVYGSSRIGSYISFSQKYTQTLGFGRFELTNHLGSVLSVIADNKHKTGTTYTARIISQSDFYAYGWQLSGRIFSESSQRHGYQGSEKSPYSNGNYTTFFRELNTRNPHWWSIDPKIKAGESPYVSMGANPVWANDVLGDVAGWDVDTKSGTFTYDGKDDEKVRVDGKEVISRNENGNTIKSPEATDEDLVNYTKFAINLLYNRDFNVDVSTVPHNSFATEQGGFVMEGYELFETFTFSDKRHIDSYTRFTVSNSLSIIATDRNEIPFWYENPMDLFTALEHEFGHEKVNFFHTINLNTPLYRGGERRIEFVRDNYVSLLQTPKSVKITSCKPRGEKATPSIIIDAIRKFSNEVNTILRYEWTSPFYEHSTERYKRHSVRYYDFNLFNLQNWQNAIPVYNSYFE